MLVYRYDGTVEGLLSAVFQCFAEKRVPDLLTVDPAAGGLIGELVEVACDRERSERVVKGIVSNAGPEPLINGYHALLAEAPDPTAVLRYLILAVQRGRRILGMIGEEPALTVLDHCRKVRREAHKYQGFVRFRELSDGSYYAPIAPKHQVLPLLGGHFARRLSDRRWILHDRPRRQAAVYDGETWRLMEAELLEEPDYSEGEAAFRALWETFFDAVAVRERADYRRQRRFVPLYCRAYMNEFNRD